jgi:hypothetical protein
MNYSTIPFEIELPEQEIVFDLTEFYNLLLTLVDKRGQRGKRYLLAVLLTIAVLAKLAGQNQIREIAHCVLFSHVITPRSSLHLVALRLGLNYS